VDSRTLADSIVAGNVPRFHAFRRRRTADSDSESELAGQKLLDPLPKLVSDLPERRQARRF